jgi:O-antigen ligase
VTVWSTDPFWAWGYEIAVFTLADWECFKLLWIPALCFRPVLVPMAAISLWGFLQLAVGATVYRWATINIALQNLALAATALGAFLALRRPQIHAAFLRRIGCYVGPGIALVGVLAYWTSSGKILWIYSSVYPDNWGPFPSRNNFAQFLELCFPLALYETARNGRNWTASIAPAAILGAGLASASRAGAALLLAEAAVVVWLLLRRPTRDAPMPREVPRKHLRTSVLTFAGGAVAFAALAGAGTLVHRLAERDPFQLRREIFRSTVAMIAQRPWLGYGLGAYATVYPEFAEFDSGAVVDHAHNDWLEWTAEGGVFYAAMWAWIAIWAVRPALRSVWGVGILAVFLHALVDYPFARLGVSAWAFLLIGALAQEAEKSPRRELLKQGMKECNLVC